jgi:putative glutamine amidotransferase
MGPLIGITTTPSTHLSETLQVQRPIDSLDRSYVESVTAAGGVPVLLPVIAPTMASAIINGLDGLVLSGGGDLDPHLYGQERAPETRGINEARDAFEMVIARLAVEAGLPTLFICRGAQVLNVARGGSLLQHLPEQDDRPNIDPSTWHVGTHATKVEPDSLLAEVVGGTQIEVNSLHHQGVDRLGEGMRVVAVDDAGVAEAIEIEGNDAVLAVQWHPEMLHGDEVSDAMFVWLVQKASARSVA